MALESHLATLDGVDESVSALYKQVDTGYLLDVNDVTTESGAAFGLGDFGGLKSALVSERANSQQYKADLAKYNGIDIQAATTAMDFQSKYTGKTNDDFEGKLAEMRTEFDGKLTTANDVANAAITAKNDFQLGHVVDAALMGRDDINPSMSKFLRREVMDSAAIGDSGVFIKDANGNARMSAQASNTGNMNVGELIDSMASNVDTYGGFFKAQGAGAGSGNNSNQGKPTAGGLLSQDQFRALDQGAKNAVYLSNPAYYKPLV